MQMHAEQIEAVVAILFVCHTNLPNVDARIWPHFYMKTCGLSMDWHVNHCEFLICDYLYY